MARDKEQKICVFNQQIAAPTPFFNFLSEKQITSPSYQHSISFTHGLQHYCFPGQANLYLLCGL